jgi:hypothetical protein
MLLLVIQFFVFTSTFAELVISALPDAETGGKVALSTQMGIQKWLFMLIVDLQERSRHWRLPLF